MNDKTKRIFLSFINCSFGKNVDFSNLEIDSLLFDNCSLFEKPFDLNKIKVNKLNISIINTDVKNFILNYGGQFKLFFPDETQPEDKNTGYENLLAKFKTENKLESFQNLDVEYTQYKYKQYWFLGWIANAVNCAWWYYGYKKWIVLLWTIGFLLIFYFINLYNWESVKCIYSVIPDEEFPYFGEITTKKAGKIKKRFNVFVFTAFIFFSLKIDFDKLSYKNSKLLAYFFLQYILGLVCMLFIVNAILKF